MEFNSWTTPVALGQLYGGNTANWEWINYQWTPQGSNCTCPYGCNLWDAIFGDPYCWNTGYSPAYFWLGESGWFFWNSQSITEDGSTFTVKALHSDIYDFLISDYIRYGWGSQTFWAIPYWQQSSLWTSPNWFWDGFGHSGCPWGWCGGWDTDQYNPPGWDFHPNMCRHARVYWPQCVTANSSNGVQGNFCGAICGDCWCPPFTGWCVAGTNDMHTSCYGDMETLAARSFIWSNFNTCSNNTTTKYLYDSFLLHWHWRNSDYGRRMVLMFRALPNGGDYNNYPWGANGWWLEQDMRPSGMVGYRLFYARWPGWDPNTQKTSCYDDDQNGACDWMDDGTYDIGWWANQLLVCKQRTDGHMYAYWWSEPDASLLRDFQRPRGGSTRSTGMYDPASPPKLAYTTNSNGPLLTTRNYWHRYVPKIWPMRQNTSSCSGAGWGECYDSGGEGSLYNGTSDNWAANEGRIGFWADPFNDPWYAEANYTRVRIHRYCGACPPTELVNRNWNYGGSKAGGGHAYGTDTVWPEGQTEFADIDKYNKKIGLAREAAPGEWESRVWRSADVYRNRIQPNGNPKARYWPLPKMQESIYAQQPRDPYSQYLAPTLQGINQSGAGDPFNLTNFVLGSSAVSPRPAPPAAPPTYGGRYYFSRPTPGAGQTDQLNPPPGFLTPPGPPPGWHSGVPKGGIPASKSSPPKPYTGQSPGQSQPPGAAPNAGDPGIQYPGQPSPANAPPYGSTK